jgi:hypothetical protein
VCNLGPQCANYVPSGWYENLTSAYTAADFSAPAGSKISLLVTPGNYTEFIILDFDYADLFISALYHSVVSTSNEVSKQGNEENFEPPILLGAVSIHGGFYQFDNNHKLNLTLVGVILSTDEPPESPLHQCIMFDGRGSLLLHLNASFIHCNVHFHAGDFSSIYLHYSSLLGAFNDISMGEHAHMDLFYAFVANSSFSFGDSASVSLSHAKIIGTNIYKASTKLKISFDDSFLWAPVNVTALDKLTLSMSKTITTEVFHVKSGKYLRSFLDNDIFGDYILLSALQMQSKIANNTFFAHERARSPRNQLSAGNLILLATCTVNMTVERNRFYNGTMFLVMQSKRPECQGKYNVLADIHYNIFPTRPRVYSFADILKEPAVPALGFFPIENLLPLDTDFFTTTLNATLNFWGDPSGPFHCCVKNGSGAYTTNQVDFSNWCIDENCHNSSGITVADFCIIEGCPQIFTSMEKIIFWLCFALGVIILLGGLFILMVMVRRSASIGHETMSDVADTCYKILFVGLGFSLFGALLTIGTILPLLISTNQTGHQAHQERIPFRGVVIMVVFMVLSGMQVVLNPLLALAIRAQQKTQFRAADYLFTPLYLWNIVVMDTAVTLALWWIPFSGFNEFFEPFFLTHPTDLNYLILVPGLLLVLTSLVGTIPIHIIISRVRHFEYSRMNDTIDESLLDLLRHEPEIEMSSGRLRQWISITFVTGLITVLLSIFDVIHDPYATYRYLVVIIQIILALISLAMTIYLTFAYYRVHLLTVSMVVMLMWVLGTISDLWFWSIYIVFGDSRLANNILHIFSTTLWGLALTITVFLLYKLRESTLTLLPAAIASNLNYHLDRSWNNSTRGSRDSSGTGGSGESRIRPSLLRDLADYSSTDAEEEIDEVEQKQEELDQSERTPLILAKYDSST